MNRQSIIRVFMQDIINYIDDKFTNDTRLASAKKPMGSLAFQEDFVQKTTKHFYVVQCLSNAPKDETFVDISTISISLEISVFALKGNFDGNLCSAEVMSINLQDAISDYMAQLKFNNANENICLMREITSSPAIPYEDGKRAYFSTLRYEFSIAKDYVSPN